MNRMKTPATQSSQEVLTASRVSTAICKRLARRFQMAAVFACMFMLGVSQVHAADKYVIDTKGAHAFIQFKISHLGFSWLLGQFNEFSGTFMLDEAKPENSSVMVDINVASLDSNHAERDKHLRGKDFFDVKSFPKAQFKSTKIVVKGDKQATIYGDLTLKGVTKNIKKIYFHVFT